MGDWGPSEQFIKRSYFKMRNNTHDLAELARRRRSMYGGRPDPSYPSQS